MLSNAYYSIFLHDFVLIEPRKSPPNFCKFCNNQTYNLAIFVNNLQNELKLNVKIANVANFAKPTSPASSRRPAATSLLAAGAEGRPAAAASSARQASTSKTRQRLGAYQCRQTLEASFSAVSKPNFAIKYSLESSLRDLQDLHAFAPLRPQYFSRISSICFGVFNTHFCTARNSKCSDNVRNVFAYIR